jgi:hypothetical protein
MTITRVEDNPIGPRAGPARLTALLRDAGFGRIRITTPVTHVIEARP